MLALLMALMGMSAAAQEEVKSLSKGYTSVLFSNGYTGFCIDLHGDLATVGSDFSTLKPQGAVSNYYEDFPIDQYLKALIVYHHAELFPRCNDGGYYADELQRTAASVNLSHLFWMFSDRDFLKVNKTMSQAEFEAVSIIPSDSYNPIVYSKRLQDLIADIVQEVDGKIIDDHGVVRDALTGKAINDGLHKIDDETYARFDFMVMDSKIERMQDFFAFKVTYYRDIDVMEGARIDLNAAIQSKNKNAAIIYTWTVSEDGKPFAEMTKPDGTPVGSVASYAISSAPYEGHDGNQYRCTVEDVDRESNGDFRHYKMDYVYTVRVKIQAVRPEIISPETDRMITYADGEEAELSISVKEQKGNTFKWYKMGDHGAVEIEDEAGRYAGASTHTLIVKNCSSSDDNTAYFCKVTNSGGSVTSKNFVLKRRNEKPPVIRMPKNKSEMGFYPGETLTLCVVAENADTYQWFVDRGDGKLQEIPDADESSYSVAGADADQDGWVYICCASNEFGEAFSPAFILRLAAMPEMPKTGDDSALLMWVGIALTSMMSVMLLLRRRSSVR